MSFQGLLWPKRSHLVRSVLAALCLPAAAATADPLTDRIADSAAAAQSLQGAFDGAWVLRADVPNGAIYQLQITDPPNSAGSLVGAWSGPRGEMGSVELTRLTPDRIAIVMDTRPELRLTLHARGRSWIGALPGGGNVVLTRRLASDGPPV